jgi:hypothetical protein
MHVEGQPSYLLSVPAAEDIVQKRRFVRLVLEKPVLFAPLPSEAVKNWREFRPSIEAKSMDLSSADADILGDTDPVGTHLSMMFALGQKFILTMGVVRRCHEIEEAAISATRWECIL